MSIMSTAKDVTISKTISEIPVLGGDDLATESQSLGYGLEPIKMAERSSDTKSKPNDHNGMDITPDNDTQPSQDNALEGSSRSSEQEKESDEPVIDADNAMEENFIKRMLNYHSGDINETIELQSQLVSLMPDHRSEKPSQLNNLAASYQSRFNRFGELTDIEMAINSLNNAISLLPVGHLGIPVCLNNLGSAYRSRYERLGGLEDLQKAAMHQEQAVSLMPDTYEDKPSCFNNIGNTYQRRFEQMDDLEALQKAIFYKTQAVALTPDGHVKKPTFLSNLGSILKGRFERRGDLADIQNAIDYQHQAVGLTPDDDEGKPIWLNNLGISYQRRFERLGQVGDIENAIVCQTKALMITPEGHADRPAWMSNLGISYQYRHKVLGETEDITRSIDYQSQALSLCPENHHGRASILLNLGNSLYRRFVRFGRTLDMDKAIECLSTAISLLPIGHADRPIWLNNLGGFYNTRYDLFREQKDIQMATDSLVKSLSLVPDDHPRKPGILVNLGVLYEFSSEPLLIDVAINCFTRAVTDTPDRDEAKSAYIQHLGWSHHLRCNHFKDPEDLNEAIRHQTTAITLVSKTFAHKSNWLNDLGQSYQYRFDCKGDLEDLNKAMSHYNAALSSTSDDYAYRSSFHYNLACAYEARFASYGTREDLSAAISSYGQASRPSTSKLSTRTAFLAARKWAKLAFLHNLPSAHEAYKIAMELVPRLLWLGSTIEQRYEELKTMGDLASEAASYAISIKSYDLALEWLEQGRSVVWNQILELCTPFDALSAIDENLARDLQSVGRSLEHAGSRQANMISLTGEMLDLKRDAQRHRELAFEWESLLDRVRKISGFEGFLLPKVKEDLQGASRNGPVIVINVGETQGDALIIVPNSCEIAHVPLAELSRSKALSLRSQLHPLLQDKGLISREARGVKLFDYNTRVMFESALATLWTNVVEPVFSYLGIIVSSISSAELPHVTWCTTGELTGLPLHAAGLYDSDQPGTFDLVVSSYTPTLNALLVSFHKPFETFSGILAVGQADTPGFPRISNTVAELAFIKERSQAISSAYIQLDDNEATVEAVLMGMEYSSWVHFACHASQSGDSPADSSFHLCDGSLKLSTITQKSFTDRGLAFLSACQTATGTEDLPDEAVHLAAGLLMAGYPSVIATLWSVYDEDAPEIHCG
ncbi:putative aromatic di-alanine and TPR containing protein [Rhizoctonia solani 123E]|uniref:Putative aromatic di-alanine and TPR containing protein n=1 Tax=Rhizoctonia solani 123E TaxID=1423351 RepID=A0A074S682_9AGAM|nr:putative aromatic di-alanine and TPR containing protein [Rhizoctonia solani 123E]